MTIRRDRSAVAFTLVELLVVIGIIALLLGVLLPALGRAREASKQTACLSNLRQISTAILMYANDNKGWLPASSRGGGPFKDQDWVQYQPNRDLDHSAIGKYLGKIIDAGGQNSSGKTRTFNKNVMRCPSDNWDVKRARFKTDPAADYPYSYVMNQYIGTGYIYSLLPNQQDVSGAKAVDAAPKLTKVRRPSEKLLIFEEAEATIDDGHASADLGDWCNLLSIRHDRRRANPEPTGSFHIDATLLKTTFNGGLKGNVGFCDGSARYISRSEMHTPSCYYPRR